MIDKTFLEHAGERTFSVASTQIFLSVILLSFPLDERCLLQIVPDGLVRPIYSSEPQQLPVSRVMLRVKPCFRPMQAFNIWRLW